MIFLGFRIASRYSWTIHPHNQLLLQICLVKLQVFWLKQTLPKIDAFTRTDKCVIYAKHPDLAFSITLVRMSRPSTKLATISGPRWRCERSLKHVHVCISLHTNKSSAVLSYRFQLLCCDNINHCGPTYVSIHVVLMIHATMIVIV